MLKYIKLIIILWNKQQHLFNLKLINSVKKKINKSIIIRTAKNNRKSKIPQNNKIVKMKLKKVLHHYHHIKGLNKFNKMLQIIKTNPSVHYLKKILYYNNNKLKNKVWNNSHKK